MGVYIGLPDRGIAAGGYKFRFCAENYMVWWSTYELRYNVGLEQPIANRGSQTGGSGPGCVLLF